MTDVVIVGGSIAGASLAIALARQGREVVLLDRATFPREKPCGEGLMPAGVQALDRLGIRVQGRPFLGVRYHHGDLVLSGCFPRALTGLGIRRRELDAALWNTAAAEPNVHALSGVAVDAVLHDTNSVTGVIGGGIEYRAPLTVAADGVHSTLRHKLGWSGPSRSRRFGVRRHYRLPQPAPPWINAYREGGRETYVTPLCNNELLVGSLQERGPVAPRPRALEALLEGAEEIDSTMGVSPLTVRATQRYCDGCVLLGDAAGNSDPITGGGMSQALLSSEILARHLTQRQLDLAAFDREREHMLTDYRRLTALVLTLNRNTALTAASLRLLEKSPRLFSHLIGVAAGCRPFLPWGKLA